MALPDPTRPVHPELLPWVLLLLPVLAGPPAWAMLTEAAPARWLIDFQMRRFGGYLQTSTFALLLGAWLLARCVVLLFVAVAVRATTGKTVVQLLRERRS